MSSGSEMGGDGKELEAAPKGGIPESLGSSPLQSRKDMAKGVRGWSPLGGENDFLNAGKTCGGGEEVHRQKEDGRLQ